MRGGIVFWNYFQLVLLGVVLCLVGLRAILLRLKQGISPFRISHWTEVSLVSCALLEITFLLRQCVGLQAAPAAFFDVALFDSQAILYIGAALLIIGAVVLFAALISFGDSWRVGIDKRTAGPLITSGIFALSRNPIFVFIDMYLLGTFLLNRTLVFLSFAVAGSVLVHAQIRREERFLLTRYGATYQDYCSKTPRYLRWKN